MLLVGASARPAEGSGPGAWSAGPGERAGGRPRARTPRPIAPARAPPPPACACAAPPALPRGPGDVRPRRALGRPPAGRALSPGPGGPFNCAAQGGGGGGGALGRGRASRALPACVPGRSGWAAAGRGAAAGARAESGRRGGQGRGGRAGAPGAWSRPGRERRAGGAQAGGGEAPASEPRAGPERRAMAETKIIYHMDEEETPYLVKLPVAPERVTLADFKNVLSNRPVHAYKFFFKSMDQDFGSVGRGAWARAWGHLPAPGQGLGILSASAPRCGVCPARLCPELPAQQPESSGRWAEEGLGFSAHPGPSPVCLSVCDLRVKVRGPGQGDSKVPPWHQSDSGSCCPPSVLKACLEGL